MERRLGRGLGSLLSSAAGDEQTLEVHQGASHIPLGEIRANPFQPRRGFDAEALDALERSIREHGVLQPIILRRAAGGYELVAGERRLRAAGQAGLESIPAIVRPSVSDEEMLELALVENVQREDLDAIEKARGYQSLIERLGLTQEQVAGKVGLQRTTVANHLRLLDLPREAREAVSSGLISMGHARALLGLERERDQLRLVARIAREGLSVRQVEGIVRDARTGKKARGAPGGPRAADVPPWARELERRMRAHLGTKVHIHDGPGNRGRIVLEYFNRQDLDRLTAVLAPDPGI